MNVRLAELINPTKDCTHSMKFLPNAINLALFALGSSGGGCSAAQLPDDTITSVPSANNFIIDEVTTDQFRSDTSKPLKIQSDVPLSIHRFVELDDFIEADPIKYGEGIVLVTSNCDTSGSDVIMPQVSILKGAGGSGSTFVTIELGISDEDASDMPFLESSSYDSVWYEYGCGLYTDPGTGAGSDPTAVPTRKPTLPNIIDGGGSAVTVEPTMCMSEGECDDMRLKMGIASFSSDNSYPAKGQVKKRTFYSLFQSCC